VTTHPSGPHEARPADDPSSEDAPLDPAASAALIDAQRARVAVETDVDGRLLFGAWGVAWLLGFGALFLVAGDEPVVDVERGYAGLFFAAVLVAAMVVTAVHLARRTAGVRGTSATQGAMYGWSWFVGFGGLTVLSLALGRAGANEDVMATTWTIAPPLLVGVLYMAGAAIWQDRTQFALGVWISVVTMVAAIVGGPGMLAVMALAGGGGMIVAAFSTEVRRRRVRGRPSGPQSARGPV
jgi:hypothetical protein